MTQTLIEMSTSSIVNLDPLRKLLRDNKSAIRKALELFVESTKEDMKHMNEYVEEKKLLEASRIAHSLKSRFVYLGNEDAVQKVRTLEGFLKDGRKSTYSETIDLLSKLNQMIDFCIREVDSEIASLSD